MNNTSGAIHMANELTATQINSHITFQDWNNDELNSMAIALKYARAKLVKKNIWSYRLGDQVKFTGRSGRAEVGQVVKVAQKFVTVKCGMTTWRVPANMLEAA
jgi:hypothetical protein